MCLTADTVQSRKQEQGTLGTSAQGLAGQQFQPTQEHTPLSPTAVVGCLGGSLGEGGQNLPGAEGRREKQP